VGQLSRSCAENGAPVERAGVGSCGWAEFGAELDRAAARDSRS
jgi:hypothetical protein